MGSVWVAGAMAFIVFVACEILLPGDGGVYRNPANVLMMSLACSAVTFVGGLFILGRRR